MKLKKITFCIFLIIILLITTITNVYGIQNMNETNKEETNYSEENLNNELQNQKEQFGITDFLKETKKYTDTTLLEDINLSETLNSAIQGNIDNNTFFNKILKLLGSEVKSTLKVLVSILVIVLINGILKSITDNLEGGQVSKIIYYTEYILIVTIIMSNTSQILETVKDTIQNLVGFVNTLIPLLITLMIYTGNIATSTVIEPILLFMIEFIGNIIEKLILPGVSLIVIFVICSKISEKIQLDKMTKFMKSSIGWFLGVILTLFVGVMSLEGTLTSSVDGVTAKTTKAAVSSLIPVVGKVLGDAVDTVLGCRSSSKKCSWISRSNCNNWDLFTTNYQTSNIFYNV